LEATRQFAAEAVFIHMSTNKVYGDAPNELPLIELETRWDYEREADFEGIDENCRIDHCLHSLFGASKAASDLMAQEYGRYFNMNVGVFRGGCLTGPQHAGAEQHGFLNYLFRTIATGGHYTVFGYQGKQVRDQIHCEDVVQAMHAFYQNPRQGAVYNIGGCRENSASVLECITLAEDISGEQLSWSYLDEARKGDHICYISNMAKFRDDYPDWHIQHGLPTIGEQTWHAVREHVLTE
ncbi:MAG: NAD-dependent epimerase/dehydratase family protein, partial [Planctomycetaceae bacterium]